MKKQMAKGRQKPKRQRRLPKAKKAREKRKLLKGKEDEQRAKRPRPDRVFGGGLPVRNMKEAPFSDGPCVRDHGVAAVSLVTWEHWHSGMWKPASRKLCGKHAAKFLGRARGRPATV